jgi:hypothetical protein
MKLVFDRNYLLTTKKEQSWNFTIEDTPYYCSTINVSSRIHLKRNISEGIRIRCFTKASVTKLSILCSFDYLSLIDPGISVSRDYEIGPLFRQYFNKDDTCYRYYFPALPDYDLVGVRIVISSRRILNMKALWNSIDSFIYWIPEEVLSDILDFVHFEHNKL